MFFIVAEKNFKYFFSLSAFGEPLQEWIQKSLSDDSDESDTDEEPRNETEVHDVTKILASVEDRLEYKLPKHWRCAAYAINLIASVDSEKAFSDTNCKKAHRCAFGKAIALWNKQQR